MGKRIILIIGILLVNICLSYANDDIVVVCDKNSWYPFTFCKDEPSGIHIDLVKLVSKKLGWNITITCFPWKRCLNMIKYGTADILVSASYKDERAEYMTYPPDLDKFYVSKSEYIVITIGNIDYDFDGNIQEIPRPIRTIRGYSIVGDFQKKYNITIKQFNDLTSLFRPLFARGDGSIVLLYENTILLSREDLLRLKLHKQPITSKNYYITFSKKSKISAQDRIKFWNELYLTINGTEFSDIMKNY